MTFFSKIRVIVLLILCFCLLLSASVSAQIGRDIYAVPVSWSPEGKHVAIVNGNDIVIYDANNKNILRTLVGHGDFIPITAWNTLGNQLASSSYDGTLKIWNILTGELIATLEHGDFVVFSMWSPNGKNLVSSVFDSNPTLFVWDTTNFTLVARYNGGTITDAKFSSNGHFFAISTSLTIYILDGMTFQLISSSPRTLCCSNQMQVLAWSPDNTKIVTGSLNGLVTLWDATTLQMLNQFPANVYAKPDASQVEDLTRSWVRDVAFSPDGSSVLAISGDGTFREWAVQDGTLLSERHLPPLATGTFSPYTGRLVYLDLHLLAGLQGALTSQNLSDGLHIIVPDPSFEKLNKLAQRCVQDGNATQSAVAQLAEVAVTESSLATFITQVKNLPPDAIPPACAADLLAIATALQGK